MSIVYIRWRSDGNQDYAESADVFQEFEIKSFSQSLDWILSNRL